MMGSELVKWVKSHKIDAHIITFVAKMPYIDSIKLLEAGAKGCVWKTSHRYRTHDGRSAGGCR